MKPTLKERVMTVALTILILAAIAALLACATKPPCPVAQVHPVVNNRGALWFLIDVPNVGAVQERFRNVRNGDCAQGDHWAEVPKGDL